jgi:hypothetical protein
MVGRAVVAAVAALSAVLPLAGSVTAAGAPAPQPRIHLSATVVVPGQRIVISGLDWPYLTSVDVALCGADAVDGSADCSVTETATMVATHRGILESYISVVLPPRPCPCVMLVTSANSDFTEKIPVKIVGAPTVPVRRLTPTVTPAPSITDLRVVGSTTFVSSMGGAAPREVEFRIRNSASTTVTPVLIGRWGGGDNDLPNVIDMPAMRPLGAGESRDVRVPFDLRALSIGDFTVRIQTQLVGYTQVATAWSPTSQWPIALFICLFALLVLIVLLATWAARRRRVRAELEAAVEEPEASGAEEPTDGVGGGSTNGAPVALG